MIRSRWKMKIHRSVSHCVSKDKIIVEYALKESNKPIGVSAYNTPEGAAGYAGKTLDET
jgi:hypothetical protein